MEPEHGPNTTSASAHDLLPAPERNEPTPPESSRRTRFHFWMIFLSLMMANFLAALDLTAVGVALPTIISDLHGSEFAWVGSGYALGSCVVLPLIGGLAEVYGRRPVVLLSLVFFAIGSAVSGAAHNIGALISGRTIQGIGGGGIMAMSDIVVSDLVPLNKRGLYIGLISGVWAVASAIGPPVGGAFSQSDWRWMFWMNIPLSGISCALVFFFLKLKIPQESWRLKLRRIDWVGNFLVVGSATSVIISLTWAGVEYAWNSHQVLVPLLLGFAGLVAFFMYEARIPKEPVIPWQLLSNRTAFFGQFTAFLHSLVSTTLIFYLPTYFQGALVQSPVQSGVSLLASAFTIAPGAILGGAAVSISGTYKPHNVIAWALCVVGFGLLSILNAHSSAATWATFQVILGIPLGVLYVVPDFPILAAAPVTENAHVLALLTFVRTFAQTWGIAIGATVLQNRFTRKLPTEMLAQLPNQTGISEGEIVYALISVVPGLPGPLQSAVRDTFAESIRVIWYTLLGFTGLGFLCSFGMSELQMHDQTDANWGIQDPNEKSQAERRAEFGLNRIEESS